MIEIIAGTNRPGSNALKVAENLKRMYLEQGFNDVSILSLAEMPQEIFHPTSYAEKPESWKKITDRILAADGLHIVVPEYNGSFPGVLKYFIDMLPFPQSFEHRCVAFTGEAAGVWGAFRAVEQLQMIFGYRNAYISPERVWIDRITTKINEDGNLSDDVAIGFLMNQVKQFIEFTERNKGFAAKSA